ncbi:hypothetical protein ACRRTK_017359 [Alexandromys fortis]
MKVRDKGEKEKGKEGKKLICENPFVLKKKKKTVAENLYGSLVQEPFQLATERRAKERQALGKNTAEMEA